MRRSFKSGTWPTSPSGVAEVDWPQNIANIDQSKDVRTENHSQKMLENMPPRMRWTVTSPQVPQWNLEAKVRNLARIVSCQTYPQKTGGFKIVRHVETGLITFQNCAHDLKYSTSNHRLSRFRSHTQTSVSSRCSGTSKHKSSLMNVLVRSSSIDLTSRLDFVFQYVGTLLHVNTTQRWTSCVLIHTLLHLVIVQINHKHIVRNVSNIDRTLVKSITNAIGARM